MAEMGYDKDGKPDFYSVLNVARNAGETEIKSAFRHLSLKYHPDKKELSFEASNENFILLKEAFETLNDPIRRRTYDREHPRQTDEFEVQQQSTASTESSKMEEVQPDLVVQRDILINSMESHQKAMDTLWITFCHFEKQCATRLPCFVSLWDLRQILAMKSVQWIDLSNNIINIVRKATGPITNYTILITQLKIKRSKILKLNQSLEDILHADDALQRCGSGAARWYRQRALDMEYVYAVRIWHVEDDSVTNPSND